MLSGDLGCLGVPGGWEADLIWAGGGGGGADGTQHDVLDLALWEKG